MPILYNTVEHALDKVSLDVENPILKIFSHFSISARRWETFKDLCRHLSLKTYWDIVLQDSAHWTPALKGC